jgi:hypothetical protein
MAEIRFQILGNPNGTPNLDTLSGSGLAFYGSSPGSSVQIGAYQDNTYVANSDGSIYKDATTNVKYVASTHPSGMTVVSEDGGANLPIGLSGVKTYQATLGIEFGHSTNVNVQNAQLRIYDRTNINYPASGVLCKVAEIINHNGGNFQSQGSAGITSDVVGSGDCFWWGEAWPTQYCTKNYFTNSSGEVFVNGSSAVSNVNGDERLTIPGSYATVGGTGIVVPLSNSPGSGQKQLQSSEIADAGSSVPGMMWPKWTQYVDSLAQGPTGMFERSDVSFGDGSNSAHIGKTYGGTGVDTHHTWAVALSSSPLSIGSKEQFGLYVSLEYL